MTKKFDQNRFDYDRMTDLWNKSHYPSSYKSMISDINRLTKHHQDAVDSLRQSFDDLRESLASMTSVAITPAMKRSSDERFHRKMWFDGIVMVAGTCVLGFVMVTTVLAVI